MDQYGRALFTYKGAGSLPAGSGLRNRLIVEWPGAVRTRIFTVLLLSFRLRQPPRAVADEHLFESCGVTAPLVMSGTSNITFAAGATAQPPVLPGPGATRGSIDAPVLTGSTPVSATMFS